MNLVIGKVQVFHSLELVQLLYLLNLTVLDVQVVQILQMVEIGNADDGIMSQHHFFQHFEVLQVFNDLDLVVIHD